LQKVQRHLASYTSTIWNARFFVICLLNGSGGGVNEGEFSSCIYNDGLISDAGTSSAWYDRLALVLMTHYQGDKDKKREAAQVCIDGLTDDDTHLSEV
jgi:hypothetical protein